MLIFRCETNQFYIFKVRKENPIPRYLAIIIKKCTYTLGIYVKRSVVYISKTKMYIGI